MRLSLPNDHYSHKPAPHLLSYRKPYPHSIVAIQRESRAKPERPAIAAGAAALIRRMSTENTLRGAPRFRDELAKPNRGGGFEPPTSNT